MAFTDVTRAKDRTDQASDAHANAGNAFRAQALGLWRHPSPKEVVSPIGDASLAPLCGATAQSCMSNRARPAEVAATKPQRMAENYVLPGMALVDDGAKAASKSMADRNMDYAFSGKGLNSIPQSARYGMPEVQIAA